MGGSEPFQKPGRAFSFKPADVLGVLLRLVFVEQRHDLSHHDVHRIVAHLPRDGDELDTVLRQLPDIELKLEVIAEGAAERMDDDHAERCGLGRARLDPALELGPTVVGRRRARLHLGLDELVAARGAIGFALALLVGDGDIVLGLPRRRDAQVKGRRASSGHRPGPGCAPPIGRSRLQLGAWAWRPPSAPSYTAKCRIIHGEWRG